MVSLSGGAWLSGELSCGWISEKLLESMSAAQRQGSVSSEQVPNPPSPRWDQGHWLSTLAKVSVCLFALVFSCGSDVFAGSSPSLNCVQLYPLCPIHGTVIHTKSPLGSSSVSSDKLTVSDPSEERQV